MRKFKKYKLIPKHTQAVTKSSYKNALYLAQRNTLSTQHIKPT